MGGMVIIGAGECGVRAAFALRERGYSGSIVLFSDETAMPYERPPLSKDIGGAPKLIRPAKNFEAAGIDLRLGHRVISLDPAGRTVLLGSGAQVGYDKLLLTTGARARLFPAMEGCLTLRSDKNASAILTKLTHGASIGIIGGGFIGLELAATARGAGAKVTVFEAGSRLLSRAVPGEIAGIVCARHSDMGVKILTDVSVIKADGCAVTLADGTVHEFDCVIAGVGAVPNTDLAEAAGLFVNDGIVVDSEFRTSDPDVSAAGDCCNFEWRGVRVRLESWKAAQDQGAHAAAEMLGWKEPYVKVPWFWSDQYELTLQVAGLFDQARPVHSRETLDETRVVFQCDDAGRLSAAAGIGPGNASAKDIRILEKLIERGAPVDTVVLADPSQSLKRLLKAD